MVSDLPSICLTLPDGCVLTVALVGMADDRFGSMFLNGIQVCYVSGSSCNVHPNSTWVPFVHHMLRMSFWWLVFGCRWGRVSKSMLSQYGQEKFDQYSNDLSLSPLKWCSYCKSSLSLSMDALSSYTATPTLAKASRSSAAATIHELTWPLSNKRVVIDNAKLVGKREETVWQKMVSILNNEDFPLDNGVIP